MNNELKYMLPGISEIKITERKEAELHLHVTRHYNKLATQRAVTQLLKGFGVDINDSNFTGTPARVEKMWAKWLEPKEMKIAAFESKSDGAVTLIGHECISVCPHHLLPFTISIDIAYIPQGYVVGLSKLPRLADVACSAFILQEHIAEFICKVLQSLLLPRGVICRVRGTHGCMRLRGVKSPGFISTSSMKGVYLTDEKARNEFLNEVGDNIPKGL